MKQKFKLTPLEKSWVLYDIGNSAFILLASTLLPIYFKSLTDAVGMSATDYQARWAYGDAISTALVAVIAPICGALTDRKGFKKPIFLLAMSLGALGCAALGAAWSWLSFLVIFIITKVGYTSANVFYDAMLPEVTSQERMDNVSSLGYAWGYIGSVIPFVVCLGLVLGYELIGISQGAAMVIAFAIISLWWICCTVPLMKKYKQTAYVEAGKNPVGEAFRQLGRTFQQARKQKHIFVYLIAFFFFINGVYTIINQATVYGEALEIQSEGLLLALLWTQIVAFPFAILFGRLASRKDTGLLIKICILCYTGITVFAIFLASLWQFWVLATLVGMFQGGIQALSRSYLGKLIPPEQSGEYYGLMDICGKGASVLGSTLVAVVTQAAEGLTLNVFGVTLNNLNFAVGSLVFIFLIGYFLFCWADRLNRQRT